MGIKGMTTNLGRKTHVYIDKQALLHNVQRVRQYAPNTQLIAMVKANAYGCGLSDVLPILDNHVDAFGVASLAEAMTLRSLGALTDCILMQGVFSPEEWLDVARLDLQCVIHQTNQLRWLLAKPLPEKIKIWVKVDTGMHRLGLHVDEVVDVMHALKACPWVDTSIGLMTHLACADEPNHPQNQAQWHAFNALPDIDKQVVRSVANSAAIIALPNMHADAIRPGLMLYGVSPFSHQTGYDLGLVPVMRFESMIMAIHHYPANARIGYSGTWYSNKPSIIGVVAAGYGDGYPRHISTGTSVWVNGWMAPIVGVVSMDMLTVDLTDCPGVHVGDAVELWGQHVPVERVATSAGTIPYELLCQVTERARTIVHSQ